MAKSDTKSNFHFITASSPENLVLLGLSFATFEHCSTFPEYCTCQVVASMLVLHYLDDFFFFRAGE